MKKLIMAAIIAGSSYCTAQAQTIQTTIYDLTHFTNTIQDQQDNQPVAAKTVHYGKSLGKVCKMGNDGRESCYKTTYAENFPVCKGNSGYFICTENPGYANATHPAFTFVATTANESYTAPPETYQMQAGKVATGPDGYAAGGNNEAAPESQSYPSAMEMMRESAYLGNYPQTHAIRVCYVGDNVAENNRNPYHGCPSPQDDGPEKNLERNLNVSNPNANAPIAPITGRNGY